MSRSPCAVCVGLLLACLVSVPLVAAPQGAQTSRVDAGTPALRDLVISADGAWMAAEERPDQGGGGVRVWSTQRDVSFTIERGQKPRISRDSRWVSALQRPPLGDSRTATPTNDGAGQTLVLLNLMDGSRRTFDDVLSYDMTFSSTYLLYLQAPETRAEAEEPSGDEAPKPATGTRRAGTLHQIPLNRRRLLQIGHHQPDAMFTTERVTCYITHPTNDHFAYVFHDDEAGGDTLRICKWGVRAWYQGGKIEGLGWAGGASGSDESIALGFLDCTETEGEDGKLHVNSALYTWQPGPSGNGEFKRIDIPQ